MIKKYILLLLLVVITTLNGLRAQDAPVLTFSPPPQNNIKFNRFLLNPAFSFVREDNTYIVMYHRNQWVQYDDSPKVYMLSYTGKLSERAGFGFGIYQQNIGVISSFGGLANYAYNVKIKQKFDVTLGFNFAYYNSGVNKERAITGEPDPLIMSLRNNSLLSIHPGINVEYKQFDLGFYAENLIDYDFKSNKMAKEFTNKSFSGHLAYTHQMTSLKDLFQDSEFRLMLRGRTSEQYGFGLGGSLLVNFPRIGWLQTGTDDYYGIAIGAGFHFTKRLSLGYTFERTTKEGLVNLGPTHEVTMVFSFKDRNLAKKEAQKKEAEEKAKDSLKAEDNLLDELKPKDSLTANDSISAKDLKKDSLKKETKAEKAARVAAEKAAAEKAAEEAEFDSKGELEKLKLDLDPESAYLVEALQKEDSIAKIKKAAFAEKVKNLKEYAKQEKQAKENATENKPVELKNIRQNKKVDKPVTLEDLKHAPDGYYVVSKDINAKEGDKTVKIEKHKSFTDAANAAEKKRASGKEKNVYIVHVDNNPNPELEEEITNNNTSNTKPKTLQNETELQPRPETIVDELPKDVKPEALKTEEDIKEFYSEKTSKPREAISRVKRLSVEGMDAGYYIIAGVYSEQANADKFVAKMTERGLKPVAFHKNGYSYVYLKKHTTWREALISYYSNVDNTYFDSIWIMSINTN
ncbi:PorP/SprF family type IX secretion system membrane protein [Flavobacterium sp. DG1-102-2]|uniref:PorP/SprF family type IX secretion system membrane protein n=1 Tax=Flavobacterium sp. DG1-102-2 TaxID=3081663 RepID=UPI0029490013|nr:PorP/SprF family type IX secretion system membrane protein [Flavobacterium sp. DG1-102-2]MDV6167501.1 PorP/SprF family type IX secretion system membrane protein [Flavobacterium sp. DG1-102-2]